MMRTRSKVAETTTPTSQPSTALPSEIHMEEGTENDDDYATWLLDVEQLQIIDIATIPEFNVVFATLVQSTIKTTDEFMELIRTEGHIHSYDRFVATLGGSPMHIFNMFGLANINLHKTGFSTAWIFANFLREHPMIPETGGLYDSDLFITNTWAIHWKENHHQLMQQFIQDFGLFKSTYQNQMKQYKEDTSRGLVEAPTTISTPDTSATQKSQ